MVSSIGYNLSQDRLVSGFGFRRTCGRGIVRKTISTIARTELTYIAYKIADVISVSGKRRRAVRGSSWKVIGAGRRKPRKTLTTRRVGAGKRKTARSTIGNQEKVYVSCFKV